MAFTFGNNSKKQLATCHPDLQRILKLAISRSKIDFGISEGHRSIKRQKQLYSEGKSKINGISKISKHNHSPSLAADIYVYTRDIQTRRKIAYDNNHLSYIAGVIDACAVELKSLGIISHKVRWGGNWDSDGVIKLDQSFNDFPHFEII